MGLFGNDTLKFDVSDFEKMKEKIEEIVEELTEKNDNMLQSFENIKKDWDTAAGRKFTKDLNTDWSADVQKYITVLNAVKDLLEIARREYADLVEEARALKF